KVSGAHEDPDADAAACEGRGEGRDHRGGAIVVQSAGEQHVNLLLLPFGRGREQDLNYGVPKRKTTERSHLAAALAAFEAEPPDTLCEEVPEERRRGRVQVGGDALALEAEGEIRASAGDEGERRTDALDLPNLLVTNFRRHKSEDADAPGAITENRG